MGAAKKHPLTVRVVRDFGTGLTGAQMLEQETKRKDAWSAMCARLRAGNPKPGEPVLIYLCDSCGKETGPVRDRIRLSRSVATGVEGEMQQQQQLYSRDLCPECLTPMWADLRTRLMEHADADEADEAAPGPPAAAGPHVG